MPMVPGTEWNTFGRQIPQPPLKRSRQVDPRFRHANDEAILAHKCLRFKYIS